MDPDQDPIGTPRRDNGRIATILIPPNHTPLPRSIHHHPTARWPLDLTTLITIATTTAPLASSATTGPAVRSAPASASQDPRARLHPGADALSPPLHPEHGAPPAQPAAIAAATTTPAPR